MKIIVTGATGFLGSALCRRLDEEGHVVTRLGSRDADLRQRSSLDRFTDRFDQIYHLAAWTQAGDFCLKHPGEQWIINQLMNTHVLDWWQRIQPQAKLISMGTSCSYSPDFPLSEENYLNGSPIDSLFTYAHSKRMLLVGQIALQKQYNLQWLTLIPSTLYGPGYHTDGRQMHFVFDLIRKILRAKLFGEKVVLWGDGQQKRELVYVEDFVDCALRVSATHANELINIGAGEEFSIRSFAEEICALIDYDPEQIVYDRSRYVGARSKCLLIDRLKAAMPGLTPTPLRIGLQGTIKWFLENQTTVLHD